MGNIRTAWTGCRWTGSRQGAEGQHPDRQGPDGQDPDMQGTEGQGPGR